MQSPYNQSQCSQLGSSLLLSLKLLFSCRYDQFLFYGRDRDKELSYVTHLSFLSKLFQNLGIISKKKTHAPRGSGARDSYDLK